MLKLGLTSVTFNSLDTESVIRNAKECGLAAIEWGSDIHVPAGNTAWAAAVGESTRRAGIAVSSYGSYYSVGSGEDFLQYIKSAKALGAPIIRVWGGSKASALMDRAQYELMISDTQRICRMAAAEGMEIAFEYHNDSLTDNANSALQVMKDADCPNLGMYFQYAPWVSVDENRAALTALIPYLKMVHVFNIDADVTRYSIGENGGTELWQGFVDILTAHNADVYLLFEFLKDESKSALKKETAVMRSLSGVM